VIKRRSSLSEERTDELRAGGAAKPVEDLTIPV
jgi:hypothetical protein